MFEPFSTPLTPTLQDALQGCKSSIPDKAGKYGATAAPTVFIYNLVFARTVLMIAPFFPVEILTQEIIAVGNSYAGHIWAQGRGSTISPGQGPRCFCNKYQHLAYRSAIPSMASNVRWKTLTFSATFDMDSASEVYLFHLETKARSVGGTDCLLRRG
jgi:hypothetical protein